MPNRTAEGAAMMRALHQRLPVDDRILDDPIAGRLVDIQGAGARLLESFVGDRADEAAKLLLGFVIRSRFTEDCLHAAHARGVRQYALIGAGLDTFPYRQPLWANELKIVEIDRAEAQDFKRQRLSAAGIESPSNVRFVAGTLDGCNLPALLRDGGLALDLPIFASLLGVSQYIPRDTFDGIMASISALPHGSEVVLSVVLPMASLPDDERELSAQIAASAAKGGEQIINRLEPQRLRLDLLAMGFRRVEHLSPERATALYLGGRQGGMRANVGQQTLRAEV